jgi:pimeloyl-ACP methyl ester carboxylesterase
MAITDATAARPDIDPRMAAMGGSFGGYMANWIAGHTDRFQAIVSHAGLWALDQMFATTDLPSYWRRLFGDPLTSPERYAANSPHHHLGAITTPMLVIHGDKDYRVPVGGVPGPHGHGSHPRGRGRGHEFCLPGREPLDPDPGHGVARYAAGLVFLAPHVLAEPGPRPDLL